MSHAALTSGLRRCSRAAAQRRRSVGAKIRETREARQLSQERLAEQAGLGRVTVVRIELGTQSARLDHLFLIADALGVPLSQLVAE